ncbi:hypothetical protein SAMN04488028_104182 [Reichenbachiella agariperforans]|uniref:Uncharacterized protein n=1 Tax=Reichenbachiella agariperforans TaxID=156994 RepID=A0A1M6RI49_REIAG|nr:hypothetical protein SAMN04488028_104182 [Reichenbachiella agariperforans]
MNHENQVIYDHKHKKSVISRKLVWRVLLGVIGIEVVVLCAFLFWR